MLAVMKASVYNQYNKFLLNCKLILNHIDNEKNELIRFFENRLKEVKYNQSLIKLKQEIVEVLYDKKQYYLD